MYLEKSIAVVVPAYNEAKLIEKTLVSIPDFVDRIIVVDDASKDETVSIVERLAEEDTKITLVRHSQNQGVGGAIITGYGKAVETNMDVTAVMAGDAQMDPNDLEAIVEPIAGGVADYTKGNRLFYGDAWNMMPKHRYLGNSFLSLLTKIASGYWNIADSQSGYTAISLEALQSLQLDKVYKRYGMPNDLLIRLNTHDSRVKDIHVRPVYNIGEESGIKLCQVIPRIGWILFKGFWKRLFFKYVVKDFHPLVFFYVLSCFLLTATIPLTARLLYIWAITGNIPDINAMALIFTLISGLQTLFFGMWFDMDYNKDLN